MNIEKHKTAATIADTLVNDDELFREVKLIMGLYESPPGEEDDDPSPAELLREWLQTGVINPSEAIRTITEDMD